MNKLILSGRATKDPEIRHGEKDNSKVASYTLAVDRRFKTNDKKADFIPCVAFGSFADWAEKYVKKGTKITICGRLQDGSYTNKEGQKVFKLEVVVEENEFAESKKDSDNTPDVQIPNLGENDDGLPFR